MSFIVVIPARYGSQRLPGKPLLDICGATMIERVFRCAQTSHAARVVIATDDSRIEKTVKDFGGEAMMTSSTHRSGTDRLHEVVSKLELQDDDVVVNVQGDEPLIPGAVINQVAANLKQNKIASASTLCEVVGDITQAFDPNVVKVVVDAHGYALYFSRAPIPWARECFDEVPPNIPSVNLLRRHIGIYAYRVSLLHKFVQWSESELEACERLEQLRILANGHKIHVARSCLEVPGGVDTQSDLNHVRDSFKRLRDDQ